MSYLEKLLEGVEVEWKTLEEVVYVSNIGVDKKINRNDKEVRLLNFVDVFKNQYISNETPTMVVTASNKKIIDCDVRKGDVFITPSSEVIDEIGFSALAIEDFDNVVYSYHIMRLRIIDTKTLFPAFLNYLFNSLDIRKQIKLKAQGITRYGLTQPNWKSLQIPIPPLSVQKEIVRILDTFTELTAELTTELTARKQQYSFYREELLRFEEGEVEWKTLGELAFNHNPKRKPITSGLREPGEIPYYGASGIVDYVKDYIFDGDFLLVSEDGANLLARNTPIAFSISGKTWVNNHAHVLSFDTYEERKYIEYYLNSIDLTPYISGAAQPKLNKKNLESIPIPNPTFEGKERIVAILDKFDTLTSSLTEGLPREIELRQKQYEYYRDLLLSFPEPMEEPA